MPLTSTNVRRLEATLRRVRKQLGILLQHPDSEDADFHSLIAGQLRVLLCDARVPVLLRLAKHKKVNLHVWAPFRASTPVHPDALLVFTALVASWDPTPDGHQMSVEEYLDTVIGAVPIPTHRGRDSRGSWYTPRKLIKWVANKDGVAHLALKPPATLASLKETTRVSTTPDGTTSTTEFLVRHGICQIGQWAVRAIDHVLAA